MNKIAVFPGSFDPITRGHESVIRRALPLFEEVIIALGINSEKKSLFSIEQRLQWIEETFKTESNVKVMQYQGLTVDFCKKVNASFIIRGLRTSADFEFERSIGQMNKKLLPNIETIFLLTAPEHTDLNSSIVRDIYKNHGDISRFVPEAVMKGLKKIN